MSEVLCPLCGNLMLRRQGKRAEFYGCTRFPLCKGIRWMNDPAVRSLPVVKSLAESVIHRPAPADPSKPVFFEDSDEETVEDEPIQPLRDLFKEVSDSGLLKLLDLLLVEAGNRGIDIYEDYSDTNKEN